MEIIKEEIMCYDPPMTRCTRFFHESQNTNKHIAEWCNRVRLYAKSCRVNRFTVASDQEWLIHWVMSNGLKNGKVADKYFKKLKNIERDMNEKNIKQVQDDFIRSEYTRNTGRGRINNTSNTNNTQI